MVNSGYSGVAVCKTQTFNFIKINFIVEISRKTFKNFTITIFRNISICAEESNHMEDHMPSGVTLAPFALSTPKYEASPRKH